MKDSERPVGAKVVFEGVQRPEMRTLNGQFVRLEKLDTQFHGVDLWQQMKEFPHLWDYLFEEPPQTQSEFIANLEQACAKDDWLGYAICLPNGQAVGYAFYLNIVEPMGSIEVGNVNFSPALQRSPAATEAMFLMMKEVFDLGYRRYEWKCNALNMPSRRAAQRLGFSWEGIFRQHLVVKSRNRDTAWLAIIDQDWSSLQLAYETWLSSENFDREGRQKQSLRDLTRPTRVTSDPAQG